MDRSERMAALARDLRAEPTSKATLEHVVAAARDLVGCDHAGISIVYRDGTVETAASTSDIPRRSDVIQQETAEGPCVDAAWTERLVVVGDVASESRWPSWAAQAVGLGIGSMLCLQLFTHNDRLGSLNLFYDEPHGFGNENIDEAVAVAAHAAIAVAAAGHVDQLNVALDRRTVIGQGTGIVMERYELTTVEAFEFLRRLSSVGNRKLYDIALGFVTDSEVRRRAGT